MSSSNSYDNNFNFIKNLFDSLDVNNDGYIYSYNIINLIKDSGIKIKNDIRFKKMFNYLKEKDGYKNNIKLNLNDFSNAICESSVLIRKIFTDNMIIPDFKNFTKHINNIYNKVLNNNNGKNASYIPELEKVNSDLFGISICTIDGQRYDIGDTEHGFCLQSCSKPISYLIAVEENGFDYVHQCIGCEPSGVEFNKPILKKISKEKSIPHNPMINAGAIMSCSMIQTKKTLSEKFNKIMNIYNKLAANTKIGFQNAVYLSEKNHSDRNMCLGFMMKERKSFHDNIKSRNDLLEVLDFYFQTCSIEYSCEQLSILAGTLANGGINPITNEKIFNSDNVKNCLSLMNSCGMYDYSGEWAFKVGIPAKSGVGGGIFLVIPGKLGIATFSPRIDKNGNSVKGIDFAIELTKIFDFHQYDNNLPGISHKINPTETEKKSKQNNLMTLLFAAYEGDLEEIKKLRTQNFDLLSYDYNKRNALHISASEGKYNVLKYLIDYCNKYGLYDHINNKDKWDRTPLDDAINSKCKMCIKLLEKYKNLLNE